MCKRERLSCWGAVLTGLTGVASPPQIVMAILSMTTTVCVRACARNSTHKVYLLFSNRAIFVSLKRMLDVPQIEDVSIRCPLYEKLVMTNDDSLCCEFGGI